MGFYLRRHNPVVIVLLTLWSEVRGHASLYEPPNRSALWRFSEFDAFHPVVNTDDMSNFCGGFGVHHHQNHGKCGLCGDDYAQKPPRDNESGGKYDIGLIVRNYTVGSTMLTSTLITANHLGYFEFSLCPRNSREETESEECFGQYPLPKADGSGTRSYPVYIEDSVGLFNVTVSLPPNVTCPWCVLRWQYITGNSWGLCDTEEDGTSDTEKNLDLGCGPQEEFRGCADIGIYAKT